MRPSGEEGAGRQPPPERTDLLVVGGGIIGAAIARDAALRGLSVALIEKRDFGSGTTATSTRLIHGGLRYLEIFDFALVREALRERHILLQTAPHLVKPLLFLAPVYRDSPWSPARLRLGLSLYDLLSWGKTVPSHRWLSRETVLEMEPRLAPQNLLGGGTYYDAQVDMPERLCLEYALQARERGAWIASYVRADRFLREGDRVMGVEATDQETGECLALRAAVTVNAGGPWADELAERAETHDHRLRLTKGVHLVLPPFVRSAVVLRARSDGRLFFAVPWMGYTLLGTTDTDYSGDLDAVPTEPADCRYLMSEAALAFPEVCLGPVFSTTAGLRALVPSRAAAESDVSRRDRVVDHAQEGVQGFISVLGGKITTARHIAETAVDGVCRKGGFGRRPCVTDRTPTYGAPPRPDGGALPVVPGLDAEQQAMLRATYGARASDVLALAAADPDLARRLHPDHPEVLAQVVYGVRRECVRRAADFLLRRTSLGYREGQGLAMVDAVANLIARELGRSAVDAEADARDYRRTVERLSPEPCRPSSG